MFCEIFYLATRTLKKPRRATPGRSRGRAFMLQAEREAGAQSPGGRGRPRRGPSLWRGSVARGQELGPWTQIA